MATSRITSTSDPELANTIDDFIAAGKDAPLLTYYNFSIIQVEISKDKKLEVQLTSDNLVNDYLDIFKESAIKIQLSEAEKRKYYYNPDLLSYDLYGTTELDFIIMIMNGVISSTEFTIPTLLLIPKSELVNLLSRIYNSEQNYLIINRQRYNLKMPW